MRAKHGDASGVRGAAWLWPRQVTASAESSRILVLLLAFAHQPRFVAGFGAMTHLPAGGPDVVDLQLSISPGVFKQIVDLWGPRHGRRRSPLDRRARFPVSDRVRVPDQPPVSIAVRDAAASAVRRLVVLAPWIAGAADYLENVLLLVMLGGPQPQPAALVRAMSCAAIVKFALLTIVGGVHDRRRSFNGDRGRVIRTARYSVVSLLIGTLPILLLDQGRDLLLGLADPSGGRHQTWFVIWSVVWAFSVWYWSRVLLDAEAGEHAVDAVSATGRRGCRASPAS